MVPFDELSQQDSIRVEPEDHLALFYWDRSGNNYLGFWLHELEVASYHESAAGGKLHGAGLAPGTYQVWVFLPISKEEHRSYVEDRRMYYADGGGDTGRVLGLELQQERVYTVAHFASGGLGWRDMKPDAAYDMSEKEATRYGL